MKTQNEVTISHIQRMCMSDGPGIRTTVFLKGCNLHCPWCANPENINFEIESFTLTDYEDGVYGKKISADELLEEIQKDKKYWEQSGGGVTFSGGEPLLQLISLEPLLRKLKQQNIHLTVETALMMDSHLVEQVLPYIDLFIIDIKLLDKLECERILGGNIDLFHHNIDLLKKESKVVLFRFPCNKEYTLRQSNLYRIEDFLLSNPDQEMEIFATHALGKQKYKSLGREWTEYDAVQQIELENLKNKFEQYGAKVKINTV